MVEEALYMAWKHASALTHLSRAVLCRRYRLLEIELDAVYRSMLLLKKKKYAAVKVGAPAAQQNDMGGLL
jgi:DNA polymerase elongation subunit (family B)